MNIQATVTLDLPQLLKGDMRSHTLALQRAGSEAIRAMRAQAVRMVRDRKAMKASEVRDSLLLSYPTAGSGLTWTMHVPSTLTRVAAYPHRQGKAGVFVQIKPGSRVLIRGAFVARMPKSGHEGVFHRTGRFKLKPGKRGRRLKREIIEEMYTTRLADVFQDEGFVDELLEHTRAVFERAYTRNVQAVLVARSP